MMPDYSIYPDMDYSLGFTTRGCNRNCGFCRVRQKEGRFKISQHPREFHYEAFKKMVLLDNNILCDKSWFFEVTDWLIENRVKVDFNQGLDVRLIDKEIAERIKATPRFKSLRIAFDNVDYEDDLVRGVTLLNSAGVKCRNNAMCYVYCDGDHAFDDALYRCQRLRELGVMPYLMRNRNVESTKRMKTLARWCRPWYFFKVDWETFARSEGLRCWM